MTDSAPAQLPHELKPADGRFGCGPSKVRPEALAAACRGLGGDRHLAPTAARKGPGRPGSAQGIGELFVAPDGYEVVLGNGGTTAFWDAAAAWLVRERPLHLTYGEFSSKFAKATAAAPFLADPIVIEAEAGDAPEPSADAAADVIAWAHNETSTGVMVAGSPTTPTRARRWSSSTRPRAPAGLPLDAAEADAYYFAPQKGFGSDGGLWLALLEPGGDRADRGARRGRGPLATRVPLAGDRARELAQGPDLQHACGRDAPAPGRPARVDARQRRARLVRAANRGLVQPPLRLGRGQRVRDPVRRRPG